MNGKKVILASAAVAILSAPGCRAPLPEYPWRDADTAMGVLSQRAAGVRTVQSAVRLVLTSRQGDSITLDGAIVAAAPDHFRLRAWKMGHAVMDFTVTPDGAWLKADEPSADSGHAPPPGLRAIKPGSISDAWSMFTGGIFAPAAAGSPRTEVIDNGGPWFTLRRTMTAPGQSAQSDAPTIACVIDRRTLTARRYQVFDPAGAERATLTLEDYRDFGAVVFPMRLTARSQEGEVLVLLDSPEFNLPTPPDAFVPPPGAVRQPQ